MHDPSQLQDVSIKAEDLHTNLLPQVCPYKYKAAWSWRKISTTLDLHIYYTVEPQLSGPHLSRFSVNRPMEMTALLE